MLLVFEGSIPGRKAEWVNIFSGLFISYKIIQRKEALYDE